MTLTQLQYIIALNNFRHFSKAAQYCNIAQPSLSLQIQKLEEELKTSIFNRHTNPVTPTEVGVLIIEQAKKIVSETALIGEIIDEQKNNFGGVLKIGIIPTLAPYLLPLFLFSFINKYPSIKLSISELTTDKIMNSLRNGSIDTAILASPTYQKDMTEHVLFNEEFVAYVSKKDKIFNKKYIIAADIDVTNIWLLEEGHCLRSQVVNLCELQKNASIEKHLEYETGSIETLIKMVDKNGGITLLPELATIDMTASKKAMLRYFKTPAPIREIGLITLNSFTKLRLLQILKESIIENLPIAILKNKSVHRISI